MPNGFPNFRHDPNTEPRYVIKTNKTSSQSQPRYTDSISQPTEGPKLSKYQYPTEREPKPKKKSNPKVEGQFEKL
ncbi:hypothetical protein JMJ35_009541 [Cladonia borealis]|uniref:Uncharacterized protein n=1 Tax=Cladonia borealis TaxID=184061 RepID=A0AA39QR63_9LECA|nr:hypothetical protein JMJ35_009541 [Cladonia borealis]